MVFHKPNITFFEVFNTNGLIRIQASDWGDKLFIISRIILFERHLGGFTWFPPNGPGSIFHCLNRGLFLFITHICTMIRLIMLVRLLMWYAFSYMVRLLMLFLYA